MPWAKSVLLHWETGLSCKAWDTFSLPLSPHISVHQRESCTVGMSFPTTVCEIPWLCLQWLFCKVFSPFSRPVFYSRKAVNFQACTVKTSHPRTQALTAYSSTRTTCWWLPSLFVSSPLSKQHEHFQLRMKLRKQPKQWTVSVQIIWLRLLRLVFRTTSYLSVSQCSFCLL